MVSFRKILNTIKAPDQDPDHICSIGNSLNKSGKYAEAIVQFNKALAIDKDCSEAMFGIGYSLVKLDRFEEAIEWFNKDKDLNPSSVLTHYYSGVAYCGCKKFEEAIGEYDRVIELNPKLDLAYSSKTYCLLAIGEPTKASRVMEEAAQAQGYSGRMRAGQGKL
jgi:tetratricopeptide (TPR) repeat protein